MTWTAKGQIISNFLLLMINKGFSLFVLFEQIITNNRFFFFKSVKLYYHNLDHDDVFFLCFLNKQQLKSQLKKLIQN
jgi:hypothetical protein